MDKVSLVKNNVVVNAIRRKNAFNNIMKNHRLQQEKGQKILAIVLICIIVFIIVSLLVYFLIYKKYYSDEKHDNENKNENKNQIDQWDFVSDKEFNK